MKKLLISIALLVMVGSAYAATVTDNPTGGLYPIHLRRMAKSHTVSFEIPTIAYSDTGQAVTIGARLCDTLTPKQFIWRAPFACKVDSFYVSCGLDDSLKAADSMAILVIGNNSGTNGDTIICDSLNGVQALYTPIRLYGVLADTAKNKLSAGNYIRVNMAKAGSQFSSETRFFFSFTVTPADR